MVIDFHTHTFPDKIAARSIEKLENVGNIKAFTNGTLDGLKASMAESKVNMSVVLPVVTNPAHITTVNRVAYETNELFDSTGIWSFGGIHPENENYEDELKAIAEYGLKGIKLHPDYQATFFDDIKYKRIIYKASELGLIISVHAGLDIGLPEPIHCTPDRVLNLINEIKPEKLVLAHMGGYYLWDEVEEKLMDKNLYFDTAYCLEEGKLSPEQFDRMIKKAGADKILFATDSPWSGQKEFVSLVDKFVTEEEAKAKITYKNAQALLGIN